MGKVKIIGHSLFCTCFYAHGKVLQAVPGRGSHPGLFSMGLAIMWSSSLLYFPLRDLAPQMVKHTKRTKTKVTLHKGYDKARSGKGVGCTVCYI